MNWLLNVQKNSKLIVFNFKFLHRRLATNTFLKKLGLVDDGVCNFCQSERESLYHLFWECEKTKIFWESIFSWLQAFKIVSKEDNLQVDVALVLRPDNSKHKLQINFILLLSKYFIWMCKSNQCIPRVEEFLQFVKVNHLIEKKDPQSSRKWELFSPC